MGNNLLKKKPISQLLDEAQSENRLKRVLGPVGLTTLGIGAIIGAGIFVLTGQAAAQYAGPAIIISFIISGIACALAGLCYAEFASMIPIAGSAYTYAYATLGEIFAWVIGWDLVLEYLFAASTVSVGWSGYVVSLLRDIGIYIPPELTSATGARIAEVAAGNWQVITDSLVSELAKTGVAVSQLPQVTCWFNMPAVFVIGAITTLLVFGIRESTTFNSIMVIVKITVIILFIVLGFSCIVASNWEPFIPENTGNWGEFGISGILRAAGVIFFAYIGFDAVSTAAQETKNPQKNMPIGILGSLSVSTILYILVALVLTGIVKYTNLLVPDPIAVGVNAMGEGYYWLRFLIKIAAIAGLSSVILVMLMGQPRIFFSMAKDGLLPPAFGRIHSKFRTPYFSTILTGVVAGILGGVLPIGILGEMVSIGTLLAFAIVCISVVVLRKTNPGLNRPFRTPWVPFVPILGALICVLQMVALPWETWLRLIVWMALGFGVFFFYGKKHSILNK